MGVAPGWYETRLQRFIEGFEQQPYHERKQLHFPLSESQQPPFAA